MRTLLKSQMCAIGQSAFHYAGSEGNAQGGDHGFDSGRSGWHLNSPLD